ncbi:MAG TPA: sugar phosphate isomerase/epimerase family protein [Planctomicrobium sp.]|nr:sugar phosphate isomerase/epimerase family protein [Planctomicrobium sp.]
MQNFQHSDVTRRGFLQAAALGAMTSGLAASGLTASAAQPIVRTGKPYFKLSLAAYSFNRQLSRFWPQPTNKPGTMTLSDFINFAAGQNVDAVELTSYYFPNPLASADLIALKEQTFRLGLDISGTAIGNDFCLPAGEKRDEQLALCRQWIDHAADLGAPVIRIFAGKVPKGDQEEAAIARCVEGINASLQHAAKRGVILALENHHGITATSDQILKIVEQVEPSPWFGINFDSGNFHTADPYADLEKIAPYTVNAQIKLVMKSPDGKKSPADLKRVVSILRQANYRGYIVLEYEEPEDPYVEIPKALDRLRELIG